MAYDGIYHSNKNTPAAKKLNEYVSNMHAQLKWYYVLNITYLKTNHPPHGILFGGFEIVDKNDPIRTMRAESQIPRSIIVASPNKPRSMNYQVSCIGVPMVFSGGDSRGFPDYIFTENVDDRRKFVPLFDPRLVIANLDYPKDVKVEAARAIYEESGSLKNFDTENSEGTYCGDICTASMLKSITQSVMTKYSDYTPTLREFPNLKEIDDTDSFPLYH